MKNPSIYEATDSGLARLVVPGEVYAGSVYEFKRAKNAGTLSTFALGVRVSGTGPLRVIREWHDRNTTAA